MKLTEALFCPGCDEIFVRRELGQMACPSCADDKSVVRLVELVEARAAEPVLVGPRSPVPGRRALTTV